MAINDCAIHWETESQHPLWQLTSQGYLRIDVTQHFGANYRLIAYRKLYDGDKERIDKAIDLGNIECDEIGRREAEWGYMSSDTDEYIGGGCIGYKRDILKYLNDPRAGWWMTNNSRLLPGFVRKYKNFEPKVHCKRHPDDPYQVQFSGVPWAVFTRYWRKPINLNRRFHHGRYVMGGNSVEYLDFKLLDQRCFRVNFHVGRMFNRKETEYDKKLRKWLLRHSRPFRFLDDGPTPFVKPFAEFFFTTDWMI